MRDTELLEAFLAEADEHLATVEDDVLAVERGEADVETINHLFRALHTVKGGASLLDLSTVTTLSHHLENVVGKLREGVLQPSEELTEALLRGIDKLKLLLSNLDDETLDVDMEAALLKGVLTPGAAAPKGPAAEVAPPVPEPAPAPTPPRPRRPTGSVTESMMMEAFTIEVAEHLSTADQALSSLEAGEETDEAGRRLFVALGKIRSAASMLDLAGVLMLSSSMEAVAGALPKLSGAGDATSAALRRGQGKLKTLLDNIEDETLEIDGEVAALHQLLTPSSAAPAAPVSPPRPPTAAAPPTAVVPPTTPRPAPAPRRRQETTMVDSSVRISIALLDKLMNLASELVLVRNQNKQAVELGDLQQLAAIAQRLNVVTSDLQTSIMQTRMRPMATAFGRFTRFVRDMARRLNKEVELEIVGAEVELDKNIIEAIGDPLTHLVRNALDHGLETPQVREQKGKPRRGRIVLSAFHQAGQVNIRVADDGKGMDPWALKEAALNRGLINRAQAEGMSDREAFNLIFSPGFSLADQVTDLSGRGVGMDVVRDAFKDLGGVIDISSVVGQGTTFTIKLPLTLAIVPALIVTVDQACFAIPQINIEEVVWLHGEEVYQSLQMVDDQEVYWLRGKLLPILRLSRVLGIQRADERRAEHPDRRQAPAESEGERRGGPAERRSDVQNSVNLVVLKLGTEQVGLLVDKVIDTEEIVVKDLHSQLKSCRAFAGSTVLGDGQIAMILDMTSLLELGSLRLSSAEPPVRRSSSSTASRQTVLLFDAGGRDTFAVPLSLITRVEEVNAHRVQWANDREYLDFRGTIMPLIRFEEAGLVSDASYHDELYYVIVPKCSRPIGLLAANILDTANVNVEIDSDTISRPGVVGSAIVEGKLTLFVDLYRVVELVEPQWFAEELEASRSARRVLLVEDSAFYATLIIPQLRNAGLEVVHAHNGKEGLQRLDAEHFDMVVSDLEMPVMGGLEFAQRARKDPRFAKLPMFAMSSMRDDSVDSMAQKAGFDGFQSKLDHQQLLERLLALGSDPSRGKGGA